MVYYATRLLDRRSLVVVIMVPCHSFADAVDGISQISIHSMRSRHILIVFLLDGELVLHLLVEQLVELVFILQDPLDLSLDVIGNALLSLLYQVVLVLLVVELLQLLCILGMHLGDVNFLLLLSLNQSVTISKDIHLLLEFLVCFLLVVCLLLELVLHLSLSVSIRTFMV